jgi:hypothetical protein
MKSLKQISLIGMPAPEFTLHDEKGKLVSLADHRGSWVVLYFYPKDMTAGCTLEAQEFRDHEYELSDLNAVVLGISADSVASHRDFCDNLISRFYRIPMQRYASSTTSGARNRYSAPSTRESSERRSSSIRKGRW